MVRLTADLIWKSPHFFNAIGERELDLRGNYLIHSFISLSHVSCGVIVVASAASPFY